MTNSNHQGNQIEALLAETAWLTRSNAEAIREGNEQLTQVRLLTESNSRAIQALTDDLVTFRLTVEQNIENARAEREELRKATIGIANLLASLDSDRPTILRKLSTIENKVDLLLKRENG